MTDAREAACRKQLRSIFQEFFTDAEAARVKKNVRHVSCPWGDDEPYQYFGVDLRDDSPRLLTEYPLCQHEQQIREMFYQVLNDTPMGGGDAH